MPDPIIISYSNQQDKLQLRPKQLELVLSRNQKTLSDILDPVSK